MTPIFDQKRYFDAFIKTAQYLATLAPEADIWQHLGKAMTVFFGADLAAFAERRPSGELAVHHCVCAKGEPCEQITGRMRETAAQVLETGFLASEVLAEPDACSVAVLPISRENQTVAAMIVAHRAAPPIPREVLNVYLAVAGLAGTTLAKLASEQRFHRMADNVPEMLYQLALYPEGNKGFEYVSQGSRAIFSRAPEELMADASLFFDRMHEEDRPAHEEALVESAQSRSAYSFTCRWLNPEGGTKYIQIRARPTFYEDGRIVWNGAAQDITGSKESEEELRRSKEFNETVLNSMNDAIAIIDVHDYSIVAVNRRFLESVGMEESEVIGRTCYWVTHHIDQPCLPPHDTCPLVDTLQGIASAAYEHVHYDKNGNKLSVEVSTSPIRDAAGDITHVVHIARDIRERKQLEEQLRQSQKMEAVGHLAGGVAHDFNNILTAIMGYSSLLEMELPPGSPAVSYVEQILSSAERAASLTQQLLAFSRKQIIHPRPIDLNEIIRDIGRLPARLLGEDVELGIKLDEAPLIVMVDPGQIDQVLMNLVTNARDAMPTGGLLNIETSRERVSADYARSHPIVPGNYALLAVTDTGVGMSAEVREKIFEPFFTTKEMGRGTGLGLSIVYGIIKQHEGHINVYSEEGRGSTFRIYLPLIGAEAEEKPGAPPVTRARGGQETILLAEDDASVRALLTQVLTRAGYQVKEAEDGEAAIELFARHRPEIEMVILDAVMPRKSGKEVFDAIRQSDPNMKTLFMSGYTADVIHKKGILEDDKDFISKPVFPNDFLRKVREILDR